jgi:Protein of unknown function (DUF1569)
MQDLFDDGYRQTILARLDTLRPESPRQWGKMDSAQMLCHCATALEVGAGDSPRKQALVGKLLAWMVRGKLLGDAPFSRNSPTDPTFVITDPRDFDREKTRLVDAISRFVERGPEHAARQVHSFFGRLSGEEWGLLMGKHLDHHLRQFGC